LRALGPEYLRSCLIVKSMQAGPIINDSGISFLVLMSFTLTQDFYFFISTNKLIQRSFIIGPACMLLTIKKVIF
jgi:hypothetical protein